MGRRSEVVKAMTLDYTFDRQIMLEREEARTEGRKEGRKEGHEEGHEKGFAEGEEKKLIRLVCKKMQKGMEAETIAEFLEEELDEIVRICKVAEKFEPDYDCDSIYKELHRQTAKE